uniref:Uncharacterized protein n=1 Tax=Anguilla anguilla TaxID=7936 RepID=A0A0E9QPQ8_ANGAN
MPRRSAVAGPCLSESLELALSTCNSRRGSEMLHSSILLHATVLFFMCILRMIYFMSLKA